MKQVKMAIITAFLGQQRDRFNYYHEDISLEKKFELMSRIKGADGVEIVFPYEVNDAKLTRELLDKYQLNIAALNVNIKAEPEFRAGGISNLDRTVRQKAVDFIKRAKDFAQAIGANKVTCCPLADGYEYAFQYNYSKAWANIVETIGEAASYKKEMPLFVEYKPSETRGKCFIDSAAKALLLLKDVGIKETGVTLDFGHSIYGNENPAEALCLLEMSPYSYYIHTNDNDQRWDWDYFIGSKHYLDYVEFLYYLKKFGYSDYITSDTNPTRWDIVDTFETNNRITNKIWNALDQIDSVEMDEVIAGGNFFEGWKRIENAFFVK